MQFFICLFIILSIVLFTVLFVVLFFYFSDSDSKIGPKIPQPQDQHSHPHHIQSHMPTQQHNPPIFPGYPSHNSQGAPGGHPPVTYSSYSGSTTPFSHQLPGYITPASQSVTGQPSSTRPPIPPAPQHFHRPPLPGMGMNPVNVPPPPLPPTPQSHQTPPIPPQPSVPPAPSPVKSGRILEEENENYGISKRTKLDGGISVGTLVPEEEWLMIHQVYFMFNLEINNLVIFTNQRSYCSFARAR